MGYMASLTQVMDNASFHYSKKTMQLCINIRFKFSEIGVGRWERSRG
jgi:hypothetical protein